MIETCEPCATCGEVTPHSRRRWAPRKLAAPSVLVLALALFASGVALAIWLLLPAAAGLWIADRACRWDLACMRCRRRATARRPRLPGRFTTFDPF